MMPHDLFQRRWYVRLRQKFPDVMERWFWLLSLAQNARSGGRVLIGGDPAAAEDVALAWDRRATDEDVATWSGAIAAFIDEGILLLEDGCLRIHKPTSWYLPPSKQPQNRDYAQEYAQERATREDPGRAGKSREEPVGPVHRTSTSTEPKRTSTPPAPPTPAPSSGPGSGRVDEPAPTATDIVQDHLPGILSPHESQALARLMTAQAPPSRKLDALRQACAEVAYEAGLAGSKIRFPRRVAIERAITALARAPDEPPDPWANPPQLPEYARIAIGEAQPERSPVL